MSLVTLIFSGLNPKVTVMVHIIVVELNFLKKLTCALSTMTDSVTSAFNVSICVPDRYFLLKLRCSGFKRF